MPPAALLAPARPLSLWWDQLGDPPAPRAALDRDLDVDVAVVGAGYTGLWTAHALSVADPGLRVAVVEREVAGFGASGRNGGWCSALFAAADARVARDHGREAARALRRAMRDTVDEVGRVAEEEGIDCAFQKGGTVRVARNLVQRDRALATLAAARDFGETEDDLRWCDPEEARALVGMSDVLGGLYTPHCAALHPARLVRGLAAAVVRRGVALYEGTPALSVATDAGSRPRVTTPGGRIRADVVVRALEGYTAQLAGEARTLAPIYSLMLATEPLGQDFWSEAGLGRRETFADFRHLIIYGQRTADGRLAFGGRGAPYHFGSAVRARYDRNPRVHQLVAQTLVELFPDLDGVTITHTWGGPIGVPRDWFSSVGLDRDRGLAWAGGYVGDGVATSNLGGRTLADLILGRETPLTGLPWVGHRSRRWEPEPLRWLGVNAGLAAMGAADGAEAKGRPSWLARRLSPLLGH